MRSYQKTDIVVDLLGMLWLISGLESRHGTCIGLQHSYGWLWMPLAFLFHFLGIKLRQLGVPGRLAGALEGD